jgi:hypothetical protein
MLLGGTAVLAQQQEITTNAFVAATNAVEVPSKTPVELRLTQSSDTNSAGLVIMKNKIRVSGPLARPFKAKSASDFARRVGHLFSPFTDEVTDQSPRYEPASARAWSTTAGWNPGKSPFPDDKWHEAQLRLISINVEKQPAGGQ